MQVIFDCIVDIFSSVSSNERNRRDFAKNDHFSAEKSSSTKSIKLRKLE